MTKKRNVFRSSLLAAGLSAAALALFAVSGCKSTPAVVDDATLSNNVTSALKGDSSIASEMIQPSVNAGLVTLTGNVSNDTARQVAAQDAAKVAGVKEVVNNLTVQGAQLAPTITSPSAPAAPRYATPQERQTIARHEPLTPPARTSGYPAPAPAPVAPAAPVYRDLNVPAGTAVSVRMTQTLSSQTTQEGTPFSGVVASPVTINGEVAIPAGAHVSGTVVAAHDAGHFSGNSLLSLQITNIGRRGGDISVSSESYTVAGNGRGKNTAEKVGGGAAVGAIIGGIFGGGKGAAIGAASGGGIGAADNALTRGQQVTIPSESIVRFRLANGFSVRSSGPQTQPDYSNGGLQQRQPY